MEAPLTTAGADRLYDAWLEYARAMPYEAYLQTHWWASVRDQTLRRAGRCCQLCGAEAGGAALHIHHNNYSRRGCETAADVIVLCWVCHDWYHERQQL